MSSDIQRRIALIALERGWLDRRRVVDVLLEIGRQLERGESIDTNIWVERAGLDDTQLDTALEELARTPGSESSEHLETPPETGERLFPDSETPVVSRPPLGDRDISEVDDSDHTFVREDGDSPPAGETARDLAPLPETEEDVSQTADTDPDEPTQPEPDADTYDTTADTLTSSPDDGSMPPTFDHGGEVRLEAESEVEVAEAAREASETDDVEPLEASSSSETTAVDYGADHIFEATKRDSGLDPGERFVLDEELGRGGSGRVVRAFDRLLGRSVAMKILHREDSSDAESLSRFIAEAQATGQLEHPNIVPIYDFGVLPNGDVFYTMREVEGHSLRHLLRRLRDQPHVREEYTLVRLLNMLRQVSQAVHYAHVRSVIHRDLKPENIMLGDYGEVLVMDWGLAHVLNQDVQTLRDSSDDSSGQTLGTPSYMPPEQARGNLGAVDERSDIYSLGAILYEILTLDPPFTGDDPVDIMWDVVDSTPPPPSERSPDHRDVPEELEEICHKAMRKSREERYASAHQFSEALEASLEGLQPREADKQIQRGREAADRYHDLLEQVEAYDERVRELRGKIDEWEPIENKREYWSLEDERDETEISSTRAFCRAVTHFTQALAHNPGDQRARKGLADLYWTRFRRAEMRGDLVNTIYFKTLVEHYDPGTYASMLEGRADLHVLSHPAGAEISLSAYEEEDRRLVPTASEQLGSSPLDVSDLSLGSYLLTIDHDERISVDRPVFIERDRDAHVHVKLPQPEERAEGFLYIPGGEYIAGGDPEAFEPRSPERVEVDAFYCARFPVTFGEYLEWFNHLFEQKGEDAMERAPQTRESEGLLITYDEDRERWVPDDVLIEGHARDRYPKGEGHEARLPVVGIRAEDAEAYCRWRGERDGHPYRLPTTDEWEKAGRGVDGRYFPWGDRFDANFCKMRASRPEKPPQPEPVGVFEDDVSPYGTRDMAGGVQEWCQGGGDDAMHRPAKGGGWNTDERLCHLASTTDILAAARTAKVGFRIVYDAPDERPSGD